ncbi:MAG: UbiX family flavin prenyltransferase [Bacteroidales bacterium]
MHKHKIVVCVTGASGALYAKLLLGRLQTLVDQVEECSVVFSSYAHKVWEYELDNDDYKRIPYKVFSPDDFFAPFASDSAGYDSMIICPCSMGTLGRISSGVSNDLITRAADVMLKERRKLIFMIRETPYNLIHIRNMQTVTEAGGIICPASPSFYGKPDSIEALAETVVDRVLHLAGFAFPSYHWGEDLPGIAED